MEQTIFSTYDLGVATVLITLDHKLLKLDKDNPKKVLFVFENDGAIQKDVNRYWNDKIKVPAQTLLNNQKMLKNRIYSDM
ncbi:MAG: DUF5659 domain-containing protein [Candidatus Wildermuthbacteria bacterium]|nr:DUF5659 domain-containing protein [Candidatus Wildermuthbacteria bacterium]